MTQKQKWLLNRLLIPAGILPPALKYQDLRANKELCEKLGNKGIEYFYILKQDPKKVAESALEGKIFALHAPWPEFSHSSTRESLLQKLAIELFIMRGKKLPTDFLAMARKSFEFAAETGAKIVIVHIYFLNHTNLRQELEELAKMEKEFNIKVAIEHDGPYVNEFAVEFAKKGKPFLKVDGSYEWMINPLKMVRVLDKIAPKTRFGICLDTVALIDSHQPIVATAKKVVSRIIHVHVAGSIPEKKAESDIDRPDIVDLVRMLYEIKYSGLITTEVNGTVGESEERLSKIYAAGSIIGLKLFKNQVVQNAQRHIQNSCQYLLDNI